MEPLPHERVIAGMPAALADLAPALGRGGRGDHDDRHRPKAASRRVRIDGRAVAVTGIAKGSRHDPAEHGDDARLRRHRRPTVAPAQLRALVKEGGRPLVQPHHHRRRHLDQRLVRPRRHGAAGNAPVSQFDSADGAALRDAVIAVAEELAQAIVRDGEGASKFITVQVEGRAQRAECRLVAYAIAHSPLVKTAFFASDPNLGRILAAVGYAGIAGPGPDDDRPRPRRRGAVVRSGGRLATYREEDGQRVMNAAEITIRVGLNRGDASASVWTCDLSTEYVKINADYRS